MVTTTSPTCLKKYAQREGERGLRPELEFMITLNLDGFSEGAILEPL